MKNATYRETEQFSCNEEHTQVREQPLLQTKNKLRLKDKVNTNNNSR